MNRNLTATYLALISLTLLIPCYFLPFLSSTAFGKKSLYSLLAGISSLFEKQHYLLGIIILVFSVFFPIIKNILLLISTSSLFKLNSKQRSKLAGIATYTGKYSLLDVLVVAVLVVAAKVEGLVKIEPQYGTFLFCIAIFMSLISGLLVDFHDKHRKNNTVKNYADDDTTDDPDARYINPPKEIDKIIDMTKQNNNTPDQNGTENKPPRELPDTQHTQKAHNPHSLWWFFHLVIAIAIFTTTLFYMWNENDKIEPVIIEITVTKANNAVVNTDILSSESKDYYLIVQTTTNTKPLQLHTYNNTPIGNGISWLLPHSYKLSEIKEITIWDEDMLSDDQLDRVTVTSLVSTGQHYDFILKAEPVTTDPIPLVILGSCGLYFLISLVMCIRRWTI